MFLDFSVTGWKPALKEFFTSLVKTAVAAGIAYAITRLASYNVPADATHASEIVAAVALLRAVLTSCFKWVTTTQTDVAVVG